MVVAFLSRDIALLVRFTEFSISNSYITCINNPMATFYNVDRSLSRWDLYKIFVIIRQPCIRLVIIAIAFYIEIQVLINIASSRPI